MALSEVTTPDGKMPLAGLLRPFVAALVDLYLAMAVLWIIAALVGVEGPLSAAFAVCAFAYAFLGHRALAPSLGAWALGLRRYRCKIIPEYSGGKGTIFVFERLPPAVYTRRTIICVVVFALLHGIAYFIFDVPS
jgi:hypothetical protein